MKNRRTKALENMMIRLNSVYENRNGCYLKYFLNSVEMAILIKNGFVEKIRPGSYKWIQKKPDLKTAIFLLNSKLTENRKHNPRKKAYKKNILNAIEILKNDLEYDYKITRTPKVSSFEIKTTIIKKHQNKEIL